MLPLRLSFFSTCTQSTNHTKTLDDLYGQDSVRSSDGFDGMTACMYNEGDSDGLDYLQHYYQAPPPPSLGAVLCGSLAPLCT
jgi:hypothetical protein